MENKTILKAFGRRVRALRKEKGDSQEGFADACGLDRSYLGCVERGEQNISLLNVNIIAKTLGISLATLMEGVSEETPQE